MSTSEVMAPDRRPVEAADAAVRAWFTTRSGQVETFDRTYYDTFDGLLHEAGLVLWYERGVIKLGPLNADGGERLVAQPAAPSRRLALTAIGGNGSDAADFRDVVGKEIGVRVLLELAHIQIRSETLHVLDELEKTVARVHVDAPTVTRPDGTTKRLAPRVGATGLRGYDGELRKTLALIESLPEFDAAQTPLVDEAAAALGSRPGGTSTAIEVEMQPQERGDVVAARVLTRLLHVLEATLPGTIQNIDPEFLHDYRVAVRRTRSVLKEMPGVFGADDLRRMRTEFRWLQEITGETRDLDVWALEFDELAELAPETLRPQLRPLKDIIDGRHKSARAQMEAGLRSERAQELHRYWSALLRVLVLEDEDDRPDGARPIGELAAKRIRRVHHRMVQMGKGIDQQSPPQKYHDLRKRGKELRYLLELFGSQLYDPDVVKPMIKALKGLQAVLGDHQDREVQIQTLKELAPEIMKRPDGPQALMALGALVDKLEGDAAAARGEFAARFSDFASHEQIKLVHDTFPS